MCYTNDTFLANENDQLITTSSFGCQLCFRLERVISSGTFRSAGCPQRSLALSFLHYPYALVSKYNSVCPLTQLARSFQNMVAVVYGFGTTNLSVQHQILVLRGTLNDLQHTEAQQTVYRRKNRPCLLLKKQFN